MHIDGFHGTSLCDEMLMCSRLGPCQLTAQLAVTTDCKVVDGQLAVTADCKVVDGQLAVIGDCKIMNS